MQMGNTQLFLLKKNTWMEYRKIHRWLYCLDFCKIWKWYLSKLVDLWAFPLDLLTTFQTTKSWCWHMDAKEHAWSRKVTKALPKKRAPILNYDVLNFFWMFPIGQSHSCTCFGSRHGKPPMNLEVLEVALLAALGSDSDKKVYSYPS